MYKTKVDIVYDYLIEQIVNGHYRSGERLIISQIAKICNVSDIPVREALRRMESRGYVRIHPNQGAIATGVDKDSLLEIFQIKGVLEGYAARLSIDCLSINDLKELRAKNDELRAAAESGDANEFARLNTEFHHQIYKNLNRPELIALITEFGQKWSFTKNVFKIAPERMGASILEHEHILELIEQHKYNETELFVRQHKLSAAEQMTSKI